MNTSILTLFTRTPLHIGAGASVGAIDQPIIRERHTGFPCIPGSALKGVLADLYLDADKKRTKAGTILLGKDDPGNEKAQAGALSIGEGKLLAFPVRSARGCFAWVTSPLALRRWLRDTGAKATLPPLPEGCVLASPEVQMPNGQVLLEGYLLPAKPLPAELSALLKTACPDPMWQALAEQHLLLASDELLSHFCTTSCEIAQHVCINDKTGTAKEGALFNQENVPAESLFYACICDIGDTEGHSLDIPPVLQLGADATTGLGFCSAFLRNC